MNEESFLKLENEIKKDKFVRQVQGWLVVFLGAITLASLAVVVGVVVPGSREASVSRARAAELYTEAIDLAGREPTVAHKAVVAARAQQVQSYDSTEERSDVERNGWARTTLTAIIGFITGFITAKKSSTQSDNNGRSSDSSTTNPTP